MKTSSLTYGQLYDQLRALHFTPAEVRKNGKVHYLFEHATVPNALIVLPERDGNDYVEVPFLRSVLATLESHDLMADVDPVDRLTKAVAAAAKG